MKFHMEISLLALGESRFIIDITVQSTCTRCYQILLLRNGYGNRENSLNQVWKSQGRELTTSPSLPGKWLSVPGMGYHGPGAQILVFTETQDAVLILSIFHPGAQTLSQESSPQAYQAP